MADRKTSPQMNDLIARLEKATGADRELDEKIALLAGWKTAANGEVWVSPTAFPARELPHFTSSIDVALTLVPEGVGLKLERYWLSSGEAWSAVLSTGGIPSNPARQFVSEDAKTPAIALCIAALKARRARP